MLDYKPLKSLNTFPGINWSRPVDLERIVSNREKMAVPWLSQRTIGTSPRFVYPFNPTGYVSRGKSTDSRLEKGEWYSTRLFERKGLSWIAACKLLIDRELIFEQQF